MKSITTALFLAGTATGALAGETYDSAGTATGQSSAEIIMLGENHMVMMLPSTQTDFNMAVDGHPFEALSGKCDGTLEVINGAALGQGLCIYEDAGGDKLAVRWTGETMAADGKFTGQWLIIGGDGAMDGMTGGGDFTSITDRETAEQSLVLTGAVTTK